MTFLLFDVGRYMPVDAPDRHAQVSGASSSDCDSDSQFDRVEDMLESLDLGGCLSDFESPSHSDSSDGQGDDNDTSVPGAFPHPGLLSATSTVHPSSPGPIINSRIEDWTDSYHLLSGNNDTSATGGAGPNDTESGNRYTEPINWQSYVDDLFKPKWPNNNWNILSRLLNIIGCSDRDADVVLDSIRLLDWTVSIPKNISELRKVEAVSLGSNE
jgi:hypothetical protein